MSSILSYDPAIALFSAIAHQQILPISHPMQPTFDILPSFNFESVDRDTIWFQTSLHSTTTTISPLQFSRLATTIDLEKRHANSTEMLHESFATAKSPFAVPWCDNAKVGQSVTVENIYQTTRIWVGNTN